MKEIKIEIPEEMVNVMITYRGSVVVRDKYYDHKEDQIVTRRAFYSKSDGFYDQQDNWVTTPNGFFHVPRDWREWTYSDGTTALMPEGFWHYGRVYPEDVISIKPDVS